MPGSSNNAAPRLAQALSSGMEAERAIDRAAAHWVVVNTGGAPSAGEQRAFARWYVADERHARLYDELLRLWEQLSLVDAGALRAARDGRRRRHRAAARPLVFGMALAIVVAALCDHREVHALAHAAVSAGEMRVVGLAENIFTKR